MRKGDLGKGYALESEKKIRCNDPFFREIIKTLISQKCHTMFSVLMLFIISIVVA